jgi:hypothetical protein
MSAIVLELSWTRFKARFATEYTQWEGEPGNYFVWAYDAGITFTSMPKEGVDETDFITRYRDSSKSNRLLDRRNSDGNLVAAQSFRTYNGLIPICRGLDFTCTAGNGVEAVTHCDYRITKEIRFFGGLYWVTNPEVVDGRDFIEYSFVDKDNVLGLFSRYGMVVGTHVLELFKNVINGKVKKGNIAEGYKYRPLELCPAAQDLMTGLYIRTSYHSFGATNVSLYMELEYGNF